MNSVSLFMTSKSFPSSKCEGFVVLPGVDNNGEPVALDIAERKRKITYKPFPCAPTFETMGMSASYALELLMA